MKFETLKEQEIWESIAISGTFNCSGLSAIDKADTVVLALRERFNSALQQRSTVNKEVPCLEPLISKDWR